MDEVPRKSRRTILIGCILVPLLGILAVCGGPKLYLYLYDRSAISEFRSHRLYYEGLVRQVESEWIAGDRYAFYILPEDRYTGTMRKLEPGDPGGEHYDALFAGTTLEASRWKGELEVNIAINTSWLLGIAAQHGVTYRETGVPVPSDGERFEKIEDRWWLWYRSLAK